MGIRVHRKETAGWFQAASHIQEKYRNAYQAEIKPNPDVFVTSSHTDGEVTMAAGIKFNTKDCPLFAQNYFEKNITDVINSACRENLESAQIAEVGPFAASGGGIAKTFFIDQILKHAGIEKAIFTVTPRLAAALIRSGRTVDYLGRAYKEQINEKDQQDWGLYYEHSPIVLASPVLCEEIEKLRIRETVK